ncbi:MAG: type II toxin-antitoxin system RelE/ParE family toxin [Novosphingobium sp.]|nr:type II toxin-antitoxin system RelE/ParE family toxin [Novosphingobium sp.]
MNFRIERAEAAREDLLDIWQTIAFEDEATANRQVQRIVEAMARLADHPRIGPSRDDLRLGLRALLRTPYLIFYDIDDELRVVRIVRVVDARRDLEAAFNS